jgi:hypothetical protein
MNMIPTEGRPQTTKSYKLIKEYKEVHQTGNLEVSLSSFPTNTGLLKELRRFLVEQNDSQPFSVLNCDVGIQVATDGRIWVCIDGSAFLRFKPLLQKI